MKLNHPVSVALALIVTMAASAATVMALKTLWQGRATDSAGPMFSSWAGVESQLGRLPGAARMVARPSAPVLQDQQAATRVHSRAEVRAEVLVADTTHDAARGGIALPSGTRLQLRLTPNRTGHLEVHAVNSTGERATLWSAAVSAGATVRTPRLVLDGQRGLETLQVVLRSGDGQALAQREVQVWHE